MKKIKKIIIKCTKMLAKFIAILAIIFIALAIFYHSMDFIFKNLLSHTSRAVLSNFIIFGAIITFVVVKVIKPKEMLEKMQADIENKIKNSQIAKDETSEKLALAEENIQNIDSEIEITINKSKENAKATGEKILQDAKFAANSIKESVDKLAQNNQTLMKNEIIKRTSNALVEIAKTQIITELQNNPDLHNKLIDESIEIINLAKKENFEEV